MRDDQFGLPLLIQGSSSSQPPVAAGTCGSRSIGVILSGSGRDRSNGLRAMREAGGITIAQTPESAEFRHMPEAAIETGCVDYVVALDEIGSRLTELCPG